MIAIAEAESPRFSVGRLLHAIFIEGGRFWERGRLAYNGIQLMLVGIMVATRWPDSRHLFVDANPGNFFTFAIIANLLYCAAYLVEALLQLPWLKPEPRPVRWCVLIRGTFFACILTVVALEGLLFVHPADD